MTTGKSRALTTQTFVSKMMSLLFNTLSRFVTAFLPRSKSLLISDQWKGVKFRWATSVRLFRWGYASRHISVNI